MAAQPWPSHTGSKTAKEYIPAAGTFLACYNKNTVRYLYVVFYIRRRFCGQEARGNNASYGKDINGVGGINTISSALHGGPHYRWPCLFLVFVFLLEELGGRRGARRGHVKDTTITYYYCARASWIVRVCVRACFLSLFVFAGVHFNVWHCASNKKNFFWLSLALAHFCFDKETWKLKKSCPD